MKVAIYTYVLKLLSDDLSKEPDLLQHCLGGMWMGGTFSLFKIEFGKEERAGAKVVSTTCEISLATHRQCNSKMTRASRKQHDQTDTEGKRFGVFTGLWTDESTVVLRWMEPEETPRFATCTSSALLVSRTLEHSFNRL